MDKLCSICGEYKPLTDFYKHGSGYRSECKECSKAEVKSWSLKNKDKVINRNKKWNTTNKLLRKVYSTISNHKRNGIKINTTVEELYELFKTTKTCPICGITFTDNYKHGNINTTQTLDRINNENEINISNVWVICYKCNTIKGDFTMKEFVDYSKLVYEKFNGV